ncbi:MAG: response regulator transcription factor [Arcobacter sp.]|uniref:response regulator transcription factor n=1 Tax=Arcobacter sp. TaxID=1872629 RepID=UPI00258CBDCD|nr:response regulator transcription factor [Arcobacter sp.]MDD3007619.1 response regulator transcription factor [Arcobacter sp.]
MKIFLLEDDYSLNEAIKEIIELENHTVDNFYDGEIAFNNISNDYDLYVLDVNTPNINGLELLKTIKYTNSKTKVVMISANINIELMKKAYDLGCDDYLKKPFNLEELIFKINRYEQKNKLVYLDTNVVFNIGKKELFVDNKIIELTKNEKNLLVLLIENKGNKISYEQIETFVYKGESKSSDAIRSLVKRIRKKSLKS